MLASDFDRVRLRSFLNMFIRVKHWFIFVNHADVPAAVAVLRFFDFFGGPRIDLTVLIIVILDLAEVPIVIYIGRLFEICIAPNLLIIVLPDLRARIGNIIYTNDLFVGLLSVAALRRTIWMLRITLGRYVVATCNLSLPVKTSFLSLESTHFLPIAGAHGTY
jgi:hypothetical protein